MTKVTGKKYTTIKTRSIDGEALAKDFEALSRADKEKVLNGTKKEINKNFSAQRT